MSQRTTRLRGPLAALLIALGVGAVLLVGEVACFSLHPGVASAANASHPRDLPEGEAFLSAVQLSPTWAWPVTVTQVEIQDPASGEIFTPELILCDQDGHREGPSMASAWQGPRARHPGQPGRRPGHPLEPPAPRGPAPDLHHPLPSTGPLPQDGDLLLHLGHRGGDGSRGPGRPPGRPAGPAGLRAAERRSPLSPRPLPLWAGGLFVKRRVFPCLPGRFVA